MGDIAHDLRQMTGLDWVGMTAHRGADEIESLRRQLAEAQAERDAAITDGADRAAELSAALEQAEKELAELKSAVARACSENHIKTSRDLDAAIAEAAIAEIKEKEGRVCGEFETCEHPACASSYAAWVVADKALSRPASTAVARMTAAMEVVKAADRLIGARDGAVNISMSQAIGEIESALDSYRNAEQP